MHCHSAELHKRFYLTYHCLGHYHSSLSISFSTLVSSSNMADLVDRLIALSPTIEKLMEIGGAAGLSLGVLHHGEAVYQANFGWRDIQNSLAPTDETIFPACSLTKAMTAATLALTVEEKRITWDTLVKDVLPEYEPEDYVLRNYTTIADLLCHRTGMAWGDNLYVGTDNNILISGENSMKYINSQERLLPFRGQFAYNNIPYELAGHVIDKLTGSTWSEVLKSRILDPIGLERTSFQTPLADVDNVAKCYNTLDDGTPTPIRCVANGDDGFGGASGSLRTCVKDLLKLYSSFLRSAKEQFESGKTSTEGSPLKQVNHLMSAKIPMGDPTFRETSYGFGWARVQLPGPMGAIGCNPPLMPDGMPVVGKGACSTMVCYHQGSLPGALAAVNLVPETESAIVVLSNSLTLNDTPDWVGQLVLEELLGVPERNDYIEAAKSSVAENAKWFSTTMAELEREKVEGPVPRDLEEYTGTYWDAIHVFKIDVFIEEGALKWAFQGLMSEKWQLDHLNQDTFTWIRPRNELTKRGRWVDQSAAFWKAEFKAGENGRIDRLMWVHDIGVPAVNYVKTVQNEL